MSHQHRFSPLLHHADGLTGTQTTAHLHFHQKLTWKTVHRQIHKEWVPKSHYFTRVSKAAPRLGSHLHTHTASTAYGTPTLNCLHQTLSQGSYSHTFQQALKAICQYFNSLIESSYHHKPNQPAKLVSSVQVLKKTPQEITVIHTQFLCEGFKITTSQLWKTSQLRG